MRAADVRVPGARVIVAGAAVVGAAAILWLARGYTFYFDEWTFIVSMPTWTPATYLVPHNEHPAILFRLLYSALMHTVGLRAYWPYMTVLVAAHVANVVLLFELVRRRAGELIALGAALLLVFLGAGWEDLIWAFQAAWLLSIAFGLAALLSIEGRRTVLASALLAASLAFSGVGLVFAIASTVRLLLTPGRRTEIAWLVPVGLALGIWFVVFGRLGAHPNPPPGAANIVLDPLYVLWGMGEAVAGLVGEGGWLGPPLLAAAAIAVGLRWWRHGVDPMAAGLAAGLVAFYVVAGLARVQLGVMQGGASRYVYVGAVPALVLLADAARSLPWHGTWRPALVAALFLACFNNAVLLYTFAIARPVVMERQVADYYALESLRHDPCLNQDARVDPLVMPSVLEPGPYYRAVDAYGDPRTGHPLRDRASFDAAVANLRKPGC